MITIVFEFIFVAPLTNVLLFEFGNPCILFVFDLMLIEVECPEFGSEML